MLEIRNLHATANGVAILHGVDLTVNAGEVHAIMGPNGSGKSTLAHVLAGRPGYVVTEGSVTYKGRDLLALSPEERAREGVFLAFQYPVEIAGRQQRLLPEGGAERDPQAPRAARAGRHGLPRPREGEVQGRGHRRRAGEAARERGLLRRREEAERDLPDGDPRPRPRHPRRDRLRPRHRRAAHRGQRREPAARARTARSSWSPTTSGC